MNCHSNQKKSISIDIYIYPIINNNAKWYILQIDFNANYIKPAWN